MIRLLARIFIKDRDQVQNPKVRGAYGVLCGVVGICFNFLLFAGKLVAGLVSKSVAVIADAFNNLSDAAASIVTIAGFKLSEKKPDEDHPFGHGRMEYIAGLIVSFLILMVGVELLKSSVEAILHPEKTDSSIFTIVTLAVSIAIKCYMFLYNHSVAKKINSAAMDATAKDSLNDCISTSVVLVTVIVSRLFPELNFPLDGVAGIFVALFILYSGYEAAKETMDPLLGVKADPEFVKQIEELVMEHKPICGIHDLIVHDYGPGRLMISLHAEVPGDMDIFELHEVIDDAEVHLAKDLGCMVTIHMDPIDVNNPEIKQIREYLDGVVTKIDERMTLHDLRLVPGQGHTNVIFDVVRPLDCALSEEDLKRALRKSVSGYKKNYFAVINVDNPFA